MSSNILKTLCHNKLFVYLSSRYITYFVQFVTSIVIAIKLGPYYFGIWGFLLLLLNYFSQCHFGIANSLNVLLVHNKDNGKLCDKFISNSVVLYIYISICIIIGYFLYKIFHLSLFAKYHADSYLIYITIIAVLQYFNMLFINIFRVKNQLNFVTFSQSIVILLNFSCLFFFTGKTLIDFLIAGYLFGNMLCLGIALLSKDIPKLKVKDISFTFQITILKKGLFLFLYNSCFYFIIIFIRTVISYNYKVEEFGLFTFSYTLCNAIMLLLDSLAFIIFPKLISKLSCNSLNEVRDCLHKIDDGYSVAANLLIYLGMMFCPIFLLLMPKYAGARIAFNLISLSVLLNSYGFGFSLLLIARDKEKHSALISIIALGINCILAMFLVDIINCRYYYVILATMMTYMIYSLLLIYDGCKLLNNSSMFNEVKIIFSYKVIIPFLVAFFVSVFDIQILLFLPFVIFVFLNFKRILNIKYIFSKMIKKPDFINL